TRRGASRSWRRCRSSARAAWRRSPTRCCSWRRTRPPTSPGQSWWSTAASWRCEATPMSPSIRALMQGPLPVTAPLVLNPLMARMAETAGFPAGYLGGGATGYQKVSLEANLNLTEMCQAPLDIGAVSSLPLILDGACGYGDPMHMHRTIGMSEAAGFQAIEIEDQLVPKRGHHPAGIEAMIPPHRLGAKGAA